MSKLFFALVATSVGATGFTLLRHDSEKSGATTAMIVQQLQSVPNDLSSMQNDVSALQEEIQAKREHLRQAMQHPNISPELLELVEGGKADAHSKAWAELRQELGVGWDSSPDYVLVNKQVIKEVWYNKLLYGGTLSDDSISLLSLSPEEETEVKAALAQAREGQWLNVKSSSPSGDIVAQLTITPPDPAFEEAQSNAFSAAIITAIGAERASLFFPDAWREFLSDLAPSETETMTIRQTEIDGKPDLLCEVMQGSKVSTDPIRYGRYPAFPVFKLFPGGWQAMAQAMNFTLPPSFFPPNFQR